MKQKSMVIKKGERILLSSTFIMDANEKLSEALAKRIAEQLAEHPEKLNDILVELGIDLDMFYANIEEIDKDIHKAEEKEPGYAEVRKKALADIAKITKEIVGIKEAIQVTEDLYNQVVDDIEELEKRQDAPDHEEKIKEKRDFLDSQEIVLHQLDLQMDEKTKQLQQAWYLNFTATTKEQQQEAMKKAPFYEKMAKSIKAGWENLKNRWINLTDLAQNVLSVAKDYTKEVAELTKLKGSMEADAFKLRMKQMNHGFDYEIEQVKRHYHAISAKFNLTCVNAQRAAIDTIEQKFNVRAQARLERTKNFERVKVSVIQLFTGKDMTERYKNIDNMKPQLNAIERGFLASEKNALFHMEKNLDIQVNALAKSIDKTVEMSKEEWQKAKELDERVADHNQDSKLKAKESAFGKVAKQVANSRANRAKATFSDDLRKWQASFHLKTKEEFDKKYPTPESKMDAIRENPQLLRHVEDWTICETMVKENPENLKHVGAAALKQVRNFAGPDGTKQVTLRQHLDGIVKEAKREQQEAKKAQAQEKREQARQNKEAEKQGKQGKAEAPVKEETFTQEAKETADPTHDEFYFDYEPEEEPVIDIGEVEKMFAEDPEYSDQNVVMEEYIYEEERAREAAEYANQRDYDEEIER